MGIIARFADIIKANVNDLIDRCEDPAKMIDQTLRDLYEDLAEVKKETAAIMAEEKRAWAAVQDYTEEIEEYDQAVRKALTAGNEGDAMKLMAKKQELENLLVTAKSNHEVAKANADKMRQMYQKLTQDIHTLNAKRENIKAQVAMAKAQERINGMTAMASAQHATDTFARMEAKAQKMLDTATAEAELNADAVDDTADVKDKYLTGKCDASVADALTKMKIEMGLIPAPTEAAPATDDVDAFLQGGSAENAQQ